jgi:hypothetical protein
MSNTERAFSACAAMVIATTLGGMLYANAFAADVDKLATTTSHTDGKIPYVGQGEDAAAMQREAARGVTKYEDEDKEGGGGAAQKTLIDNDAVKVILVSYKKGFDRPGGMKRRYDTLLVYVDQGRYSGGRYPPDTLRLAPGSSVFHRKDSIVSPIHIDQDYRVLYVEMKR